MFRGRDVEEINELKREGLSIRAISRLTGYDRKTISRYLLAPTGRPVYGPRPAPESKLEPFKPYLKERLQAGCVERPGTAARTSRAQLQRRLHDSDGLAAAAAERGADGGGAADSKRRPASRRRWTGAIWARSQKTAKRGCCGASRSLWATAGE